MSIEITLNGIVFQIPTRGNRDWADLSDWCLEVNETLANLGVSFNIPAGSANLIDNTAVNLYTINLPQDNGHIIFEYGVYRETSGLGFTSASETGQLLCAYDTASGTWEITNTAVGDASVTFDITSNVIRVTAAPIAGAVIETASIYYRGNIIRV